MDKQEIEITAAQLLCAQKFCIAGFATNTSQPWVVPLFYACDSNLNFYWLSESSAHHSTLIEENPKTALNIFDPATGSNPGQAIYAEGMSTLVKEGFSEPLQLLASRAPTEGRFSRYSINDVTGDSPWRMYRFSPNRMWTIGEDHEKRGWAVVRRIPIDLEDFKLLYNNQLKKISHL